MTVLEVTRNTASLTVAHWAATRALLESATVDELTAIIQALNAQFVTLYKDDPVEKRRIICQRTMLQALRDYKQG